MASGWPGPLRAQDYTVRAAICAGALQKTVTERDPVFGSDENANDGRHRPQPDLLVKLMNPSPGTVNGLCYFSW
jgi:hypothetical protein